MGLDERLVKPLVATGQASHPAATPESKFGCMLEYPAYAALLERRVRMENYVLFVEGRNLPIATFPADDDEDAKSKVIKIAEEERKQLVEINLYKHIPLK